MPSSLFGCHTLSAPDWSNALASSAEVTPPPTVRGMESNLRTDCTVSHLVFLDSMVADTSEQIVSNHNRNKMNRNNKIYIFKLLK